MKIRLFIYITYILIFIGCEPEIYDPPNISIIYPYNGYIVSDTVTILCESQDYNKVKAVEILVDDDVISDFNLSYPFKYLLNVTELEDGQHDISVRAYNSQDDYSKSNIVKLIVDKIHAYLEVSNIYPIKYENEEFFIFWSDNNDEDFHEYRLYESMYPSMDPKDAILNSDNQGDTSHVVSYIEDNERRYYQVGVVNISGLETLSGIKVGSSYTKILFMTTRNGSRDVYIMDSDGNNQTRLTDMPETIDDLEFSPDNSLIAFVRRLPGWRYDFCVIDRFGQNKVTFGETGGNPPTFSFDYNGTRMIFSQNNDGNSEIYSANVDGTDFINLTNNQVRDRWPIVSPDGSTIVYQSTQDSATNLYSMDISGGNQTKITDYSSHAYGPAPLAITPNGEKIIYRSITQYFSIRMDGTEQIVLTSNNEYGFDISNNGTKILYVQELAECGLYSYENEICLININGSGYVRLTDNCTSDGSPVFSTDNSKILFYSNRVGNEEIFSMNLDGTRVINLTNNLNSDYHPVAENPPR